MSTHTQSHKRVYIVYVNIYTHTLTYAHITLNHKKDEDIYFIYTHINKQDINKSRSQRVVKIKVRIQNKASK